MKAQGASHEFEQLIETVKKLAEELQELERTLEELANSESQSAEAGKSG